MKKYKNYTDNDILISAKSSNTLSDCLRKLGLKPIGGNYENIKRNIKRLGIDTSHFTGKSEVHISNIIPFENLKRPPSIKRRLIEQRGHRCEECSLEIWIDQPITLELHHKDGDRSNNLKENLQLLCPNCHSYTDNWRKRQDQINS